MDKSITLSKQDTISKLIIRVSLFMIVPSLWSCDCRRHAEGVVLDALTQLPLAEVQIVYDRDFEEGITSQLIITDSAGHFEYSDISGGLFGCPDLVLVFSKKEYKNKRINFSESNGFQADTVLLKH